ncbi:MAG: O-antigen ligase family protein [Candidatus Omnitrophota bacterium]
MITAACESNSYPFGDSRGIPKENIRMLLLFVLTVIVVYKLPRFIGVVFMVGVFFQCYRSKKDYFWLAYCFILMMCPANFFSEFLTLDAIYHLPIFSLGRYFSFTTNEILMLLMFVKALTKGKHYHYLLAKPMKLLLIYGVFSLVLSVIVYEASLRALTLTLRHSLFYTYLLSFPFLVTREEEVVKFIRLILPFAFVSLFSALYFFITGDQFLHLFNPGSIQIVKILEDEARFTLNKEHMLLLLCFIFSLVYSSPKHNRGVYLIVTALASYISILMTATRIWFVVFSLIMIVFLMKAKKLGKVLASLFIFSLILIVVGSSVSSFNAKGRESVNRLLSIFHLGEEYSPSTTMIRYKAEIRMPNILQGIKENPIFGWGFSDKVLALKDGDVGNFSLIAESGLLGFLLFINFWLGYLRLILGTRKKLSIANPYRDALSILAASFVGFLIAHFTTHQFFGIFHWAYEIYFLSAFIFASEFVVRGALVADGKIKQKESCA